MAALGRGIGGRVALLHGLAPAAAPFAPPARELLRVGVLRPRCTRLGPRWVDAIEAVDADWLRVSLRATPLPLWWPRALPLFDLYKVVTEMFDPADWHRYEVPETTVRPGDTVIDAGAAEGLFCLRALGRAQRCIAFEPASVWGDAMRRTFAGQPVDVVPAALSDRAGTAVLQGSSLYGAIGGSGEGGEGADGGQSATPTAASGPPAAAAQPIELLTLDAYCAARPGLRVDYIKADVEGAEEALLRGAAETIRRDRPRIAITVYHPGNDWVRMLALLRSLVPSYAWRTKGFSYNGGVARPVMLHVWPQ
jgi:FkbM family methyltransferase